MFSVPARGEAVRALPGRHRLRGGCALLTAGENHKLGTVDEVIEEPLGGAHRNPAAAADRLEKDIIQTIRDLERDKTDNLLAKRYDRLRAIGKLAGELSG